MKTYEKLENLLNEKQNVSNLRGNIRDLIANLLKHGKTHTVKTKGTGRHIYNEDYTSLLVTILFNRGVSHVVKNDAPRGGACGKYVEITSKAFLREMNNRNK